MILGDNWFYRPRIDVELKQYEALAFIQYLDRCLENKILAPPLQEINEQIETLSDFLKQSSDESFSLSRNLESLDLEKTTIHYHYQRDELLIDLEKIAGFLLKKINPYADRFNQLKKFLMSNIKLETVGVIPAWTQEGWILLNDQTSTKVYRYSTGFVLDQLGKNEIRTEYCPAYNFVQETKPEEIKAKLIREHHDLPNPMTYYFSTSTQLPIQETYLPLAIEKINSFC